MPLERFLASLLLCIATFVSADEVPLTVEHAMTPDQIAWGLMQRRELPPNHGMLFHYNPEQKVSFWMFNTYIDLAVAFIDDKNVIREIWQLKAYPELMRSLGKISSVEDLKMIRENNLVFTFFKNQSVQSGIKVAYALEMNANWFKDNHIKIGDSIRFLPNRQVIVRRASKRPNVSKDPAPLGKSL